MNRIQKTIRQILLYTLLIVGCVYVGNAQGNVTLIAETDPKITFVGDDGRGIDPGFNNVLLKTRLQGNQQSYGYMHVAPSFEFAKLNEDLPEYTRYAFEVGYTLNRLFIKNLEVGGYIDYGILKRGGAKQGLGFGGVAGYGLAPGLKAIATLQYVDRQDFEILYGIKSKFKYSVFVGIEVDIFDTIENWRR